MRTTHIYLITGGEFCRFLIVSSERNLNLSFIFLGAGFVGSHLIDHLLERNLGRVILLDNFNDYYSPLIKQRNVKLLEEKYPTKIIDGTLIIVRGSINDEELLSMIFIKYKITHIAHLAVS